MRAHNDGVREHKDKILCAPNTTYDRLLQSYCVRLLWCAEVTDRRGGRGKRRSVAYPPDPKRVSPNGPVSVGLLSSENYTRIYMRVIYCILFVCAVSSYGPFCNRRSGIDFYPEFVSDIQIYRACGSPGIVKRENKTRRRRRQANSRDGWAAPGWTGRRYVISFIVSSTKETINRRFRKHGSGREVRRRSGNLLAKNDRGTTRLYFRNVNYSSRRI